MRMDIKVKIIKDDKALKKILRNLERGKGKSIDVGWWASRHPSGNPVAQVAKWNEEGHITGRGAISPPRPFIRMGFLGKLRKGYLSKFYPLLNDIALGKMTWNTFYKIVGEDMRNLLKEEILDWKIPPNSPFTIAQKGFNDPLIETGTMYDTIKVRISRRVK